MNTAGDAATATTLPCHCNSHSRCHSHSHCPIDIEVFTCSLVPLSACSLLQILDSSEKWAENLNLMVYYNILSYTSGTAQGGGGSFKNRKPIGELGCCESGMAERSHSWTERCLIFHSFSLSLFSLSFSDYLPTYLLIYLSTYLSVCLSIYLPIYLSIYLSI